MTDDWQSLLQEASQLRRAGRIDDAIAAYERLLAVKPDLADSWFNLGWLHKQARAFDDALADYGRALELGVSGPEEAHLNRAVILSDHLHRPGDAESELSAALEKNPDYVPALLNLGNLHEDLGRRDQAKSAYERALSIAPDNRLALARLAIVSLSPQLDKGLETRLRAAIDSVETTLADRANLGFALGALLDAAGDYERAFEAYRSANAASRTATGTAVHYDRAAHERYIDRIIAAFDRPAVGSSAARKAPVFICGLFRSGSTLIEQILGAHSGVTPGGELDLIPALVGQISDYPDSVPSAEASTVAAWRDTYLRGLPVQPGGSQVVTDKRPDNFLHIGLIKTLFPDAKIVHTRREPRDNLLSLYFLHLDPGMTYALDLEDAAHWHAQYERVMAHWKSLYPEDIFDVDYDKFVRTPREVVGGLLDFLGLGWEDGVLEFHRSDAAVKTASVWQVRQPVHERSSGRWRNYGRHLASLDLTRK